MRVVACVVGVPRWQYAFTRVGLDPSAEQWFRFLCPERLSIDIKDNKSARRSAGSTDSKKAAGGNDSITSTSQFKRRGGERGRQSAPHSGRQGNARAGAAWGKASNAAGGARQGRECAEQARGRKPPAKKPSLSMEKIERKAAQRKAAKQQAAGEDRK